MFYTFSFLSEPLHRFIAIYIFWGALVLSLYIWRVFFFPYRMRQMSIKYLPRSFVDNFSGVLVLLAWGYAGYALGEWLVLITGLLFFILLVILVFIELYKNHRPVFESLTLGILLFILFVLVFAQADL